MNTVCMLCKRNTVIINKEEMILTWLNKPIVTECNVYTCTSDDCYFTHYSLPTKEQYAYIQEQREIIKQSYTPEEVKQIVLNSTEEEKILYIRYGMYYEELDYLFKNTGDD